MVKKIELDKEVLRRMYVDERMSSIKIAKALGVSKAKIFRSLDEFGIERRSISQARLPSAFHLPSAETLRSMYFDRKMTIEEIADELGASRGHLGNVFDSLGIDRRNNVEAQRKLSELEMEIERETLSRMYTVEGLSCAKIGRCIGLSESAVNMRLKRHGIPRRSSNHIKYNKDEKRLLENLYLEQGLSVPQIARQLGKPVSTVQYRFTKYGIERRGPVDAHKGQEVTEEQKEKLRAAGIKRRKLKYHVEGRFYADSLGEGATALLLEKYIPGYSVCEGKTFQVRDRGIPNGGIDFLVNGEFLEWHPIRDYDLREEDRRAYKELSEDVKNSSDRKNLREIMKTVRDDAALRYWELRQEHIDSSGYNGYIVDLARDTDELYSFISKYSDALPTKKEFRKMFDEHVERVRSYKVSKNDKEAA